MLTSNSLVFCFIVSLFTFALGYYMSYEIGALSLCL
jgi:hypothetical protein